MFFSFLFWPGVHLAYRFLVFWARVLLRKHAPGLGLGGSGFRGVFKGTAAAGCGGFNHD